jgi:hypothetical protein
VVSRIKFTTRVRFFATCANRKSAAVWSRFGKRPKEDTLWYNRELAKGFQDLLPGQLAEELMEIVIVLENE